MTTKLLLASFALAFPLVSCGEMRNAKPMADAAIVDFHTRFNVGDFKSLYDASGPVMKKATPEPEFLQFMEAVHTKLGDHYASTSSGFSVHTKNFSPTTVVNTLDSNFEHGHGTETFTYVVSNGAATLQGYNIQSKELVLK